MWHSFSGVGQAICSLLGVKPEGRKEEESRERRGRGGEGGGGQI